VVKVLSGGENGRSGKGILPYAKPSEAEAFYSTEKNSMSKTEHDP
jgi:hypothetical protein